jgi:hypothetical protein
MAFVDSPGVSQRVRAITKSMFHVTRISKMLHMLNMTINTVGTLNLSTLFGALFVFSAFIETLDLFFSQEIRLPFSIPYHLSLLFSHQFFICFIVLIPPKICTTHFFISREFSILLLVTSCIM